MTNCDTSMTSYWNFVTNKPKLGPFSVLVWVLIWLSWNFVQESIFKSWFLILTVKFDASIFWREKRFFLLFLANFRQSTLWKCGCHGNEGRSILLILVSKDYLHIFRKKKFQEKIVCRFGVVLQKPWREWKYSPPGPSSDRVNLTNPPAVIQQSLSHKKPLYKNWDTQFLRNNR